MKQTIGGREAYAYTGGKPLDLALPAVVLIHGALYDHSIWALQSRWLAHHGCAVLAVDLPGHGRSAGPGLERIDALADWVIELMATAGVERALMVGHSMGSLIALEAAARLGERALGLVMAGAAYPMKVSAALLDTARGDPLKAIDLVAVLSHSTLAPKPSAPSPGFWLRGADRALNRRIQQIHARAGHGNLFYRDFSACNDYSGGMDAAARVRCPVSLVLGERDQMTPASAARELAEALHARTVRLPVGHAMMGEAPDGVLMAIRECLRRSAA